MDLAEDPVAQLHGDVRVAPASDAQQIVMG